MSAASLPPEGTSERGGEDAPAVGCQLQSFAETPPSLAEPWLSYFRRRAKAGGLRLVRLARRLSGRVASPPATPAPAPTLAHPAPELHEGDRVRVRPAAEIRAMLDERGFFRGCGFSRGMYQFCGKELRVAKRIERFFDEARWRMLKAHNLVLLEGAHCDGTPIQDTRGCDRMCFYFWRTEWLEKL